MTYVPRSHDCDGAFPSSLAPFFFLRFLIHRTGTVLTMRARRRRRVHVYMLRLLCSLEGRSMECFWSYSVRMRLLHPHHGAGPGGSSMLPVPVQACFYYYFLPPCMCVDSRSWSSCQLRSRHWVVSDGSGHVSAYDFF